MVHEKMSEVDARSFQRYSVANASNIEGKLACGCKAYQDVYTYRRWQAQGYQVRRGEHAIKIPIIKEVQDDKDANNQATPVRRILGSAAVFCRHQVDQQRTAGNPAPIPVPVRIEPTTVTGTQPRTSDDDSVTRIMSTWKEVS